MTKNPRPRVNDVVVVVLVFLLQAGQNFPRSDVRRVQQLCGTLLKGPRLPEV